MTNFRVPLNGKVFLKLGGGGKKLKGEPKKNNQNTFSVAEGLITIVQLCYTTRWNRLDVSFKMITEPFLCDEYFLKYR